jgi:hypothetical protein
MQSIFGPIPSRIQDRRLTLNVLPRPRATHFFIPVINFDLLSSTLLVYREGLIAVDSPMSAVVSRGLEKLLRCNDKE